ncbi:MAG: hypothetical protein H7177_17080 [Rhizobacter sp.]|nr:hypothetical protein [Bacteriovorax sp.]
MKLLLPLVLFFMTSAHALEYRAACSGNRGNVSVQMYSKDDRFYMLYSNAMGSDDFPLFEGVVTKLALPVIKIAQEELASLDEQVLVSWPLSQCKFNQKDPLILQCDGEGTFLFPKDSTLKSYTFITSHVTEESLTSKYGIFKIRWGVDSSDFHHSLALPFDPTLCKATLKN